MKMSAYGKNAGATVPTCRDGHLLKGSGEMILLVDDDPEVLQAYSRILERLRYNVLVAQDGQIAVDMYRAFHDKIDLLILDFVMPKLGGCDVMQIIRAMDPDARLIIVTGNYSYFKPNSDGDREGHFDSEMVLLKPFSVFELSQAIRLALAADPLAQGIAIDYRH